MYKKIILQLFQKLCIRWLDYALVAEQVDAADLKSVGSNPVPVRFRPSAPIKKGILAMSFFIGYVQGEANRGSERIVGENKH